MFFNLVPVGAILSNFPYVLALICILKACSCLLIGVCYFVILVEGSEDSFSLLPFCVPNFIKFVVR